MAQLLFESQGSNTDPGGRPLQQMYRGENEPRIIDKMLTFGELWSLNDINGSGNLAALATAEGREAAITGRVGHGGGDMIPITTRASTAIGYGRTTSPGADGQVYRGPGSRPLSPVIPTPYSIFCQFDVLEAACHPGNVRGEGEFLVASRTLIWNVKVYWTRILDRGGFEDNADFEGRHLSPSGGSGDAGGGKSLKFFT